MAVKIIVVRHGGYVKVSNNGLSADPLTRSGVKEAQLLQQKLRSMFPNGDLEAGVRVYSSPNQRAVQTAQILAGDQTIILAQEINEVYMGIPQFVTTVQEISEYFKYILVVTHAPAVARITAALVGVKYEEGGPYDYRKIDTCEGFIIADGIATKI